MYKKSLIVFSVLTFLMGCANTGNNSADNNTNGTSSSQGDNETYALGDTVETDIARFQLLAGEFTYALENTYGNSYASPKEYDATEDQKNPYVAGKGHTLAAFEFYLENLDRTSLDIGGGFNSEFIYVTYDNTDYSDQAVFLADSDDDFKWEGYDSDNILLFSGEKGYYRGYIDVPVDVDNLDETLILNVVLPTSAEDQSSTFSYEISEADRNAYSPNEISEQTAIENFNADEGQEYFSNHIDDYRVMNGDEIYAAVADRKFNVIEKMSYGSWSGTFTFETSGNIYESGNKYAEGYTNNRTWSISGDQIILSSVVEGTTKTDTYTVRKVNDSAYLLTGESTFVILY